jgi:hypothetical protein
MFKIKMKPGQRPSLMLLVRRIPAQLLPVSEILLREGGKEEYEL